MDLPPGFALACVLEREDPRDAFVSPQHASLDALPEGAVVGTSSLRRVVLLGPSHFVDFDGIALAPQAAWSTPQTFQSVHASTLLAPARTLLICARQGPPSIPASPLRPPAQIRFALAAGAAWKLRPQITETQHQPREAPLHSNIRLAQVVRDGLPRQPMTARPRAHDPPRHLCAREAVRPATRDARI